MLLQSYQQLRAELQSQSVIEAINRYGYKNPSLVEVVNANKSIVTEFRQLAKGCEMWVLGEKYPMRVHVKYEKVRNVSQVKRIIPLIFQGFHQQNIFGKLITGIGFIINWRTGVNWIHYALQEVYPDHPDRYSQPVREVFRVLSRWPIIRDIICAILEYDTAYRYRFQDFVAELNKEAFAINPIKEIERMLNITHSREHLHDTGMGKLLIYKKYLLWYLRFNRKLLDALKDVAREICINEVKLSVEDIYWTNKPIHNYNFGGVPNAERAKKYEQEKNAKPI